MPALEIKKIIYIFIIIFLLLPQNLFSKNAKPLLTWKKIMGAQHYVVEIKNKKDKIIRDEVVHTNKYYSRLKEGIYKVRITGYDKSRKQIGKSKWSDLILKKGLSPEVNKIGPSELLNSITKEKIKIKGSNFHSEIKILLKKENKTYTISKAKISKKRITFEINAQELGHGVYDIILINPCGKKSVTTGAFSIINEIPVQSNDKEIRKGLLNANGLFLGIGYQFGFILPDWDKILDNSLLGVNIILWYDLGGFKNISRIKVLKNFGFGLKGSYLLYPENKKIDVIDSKLQVGTLLAELHYIDNFSLPVYFVFRVLLGATFSTLRKTENNKSKTVPSQDFAVGAEFSIFYKFKENYFFEAGADFLNSFFQEKEFRSLNPYIRIGFIF